MNRVRKNKKKGFTLVELMIVVVIMVILAAAASPIFKGYLDRAKQARYLAECRSVYVATQTVMQDWLIAGKELPEEATLEDGMSIDSESLKDFSSDVQRLAQLTFGSDDEYKITIDNTSGKEGCTEIVYKNKTFEVSFKPKATEISVKPTTTP